VDSSIDNEARLRATSVYLVDRVLPMLPEELSNGICSLNPGEARVTFSVDMTLSKDGVCEAIDIFPSVIASDRRFQLRPGRPVAFRRRAVPDRDSELALREFSHVSAKLGDGGSRAAGWTSRRSRPRCASTPTANRSRSYCASAR